MYAYHVLVVSGFLVNTENTLVSPLWTILLKNLWAFRLLTLPHAFISCQFGGNHMSVLEVLIVLEQSWNGDLCSISWPYFTTQYKKRNCTSRAVSTTLSSSLSRNNINPGKHPWSYVRHLLNNKQI